MAMKKKKMLSRASKPVLLGDKAISISHLHLNLANPRHKPVDSEANAIAELCDSEFVTELAKDISARGGLSPLEVFGVMPMPGNPGHYISLEGNRRTCALILMADPKRAPAALRQQIQRIAASGNFPRTIKAHIFANATEAKQWIDLRHLGFQGGAGGKEWNPAQKARAVGDNAKTTARDNTLSVRVLDRLLALGKLTEAQVDEISVTTLTRYLGTPGVRAILGLGSNKELIYTHDPDEVDNALLKLALDSITPSSDGTYSVNSRSNSTDRIQYVNELKASGDVPSTPLEHQIPAPTPSRASASKRATKRSANHPNTRNTLIPSDFVVPIKDSVLLRLHGEGRKLNLTEFPFGANYILRAFIEQTMVLFVKKCGRWSDNLNDKALTQYCAQELEKLGVRGKALSVVQKAGGDANTAFSLHSLGHAVHGGSVPTENALRAHFDTWRPSLEAILGDLAAKP